MVLLKDFEVKVALKPSDGVAPGEAFKEYPNPEPRTSPDEWLAERYIEAKPGQEFQVEIYLKPSLKLFAADGLRISLRIDDHTVHFGRYYDKKWIATEMLEGEPIIFDDVLATDGRQHSRVTFSFGSLKADETLDIDSVLAAQQAEKMGCITVKIYRVKCRKLKHPAVKNKTGFYMPLASTSCAKEVVKDKHIRQAMIPGSHTPTSAPNLVKYHRYTNYSAHKFQPAQFVFRYRDDLGLKQLGCIPKDERPSPNESPSLEAPDSQRRGERVVADSNSSKEDEIATLRTQVEQLRSRDDESQELKRKFDQMAQGFAFLKQMNEQLTNMFGNGNGGAPLSSAATSSTAMTGDTLRGAAASSGTTATKTEKSLQEVKQEEDVANKDQPSASRRRGAKRQRTVIELD